MFSKNPFNMHRAIDQVLNEDPAHYAAIARNNAAKQAERDKTDGGKDKARRDKAKANLAKAKPVYAKGDKSFASNIGVKEDTYIIPESIPANERTAFHGAAAAAAKSGKTSFSFNGKTHPVTMKKDLATKIADQKESVGRTAGDHGYYHLQKAKELAKKDGHDYDKLPQYDRTHDKHKDHYDSRAKKESVKKESTTFRERLMAIYENDRAAHYKGATAPEGMHDKMKSSKGAMDMVNVQKSVEADGMKAAKDTADNIKKSIPGRKMRSTDKKDGDNTIIPAATPVKDPSAKIAKMESYGVSGSKVSKGLLDAVAMVEDMNKTHTVDIDHDTGTAGSHEKKHGITLKKSKNYGKGPGSNMSTDATGTKANLQKYLKKHYDGDHKTMHPEIYK